MGSCRAPSVYLVTLLLSKLSLWSDFPVLCTFLLQELTFVLLESAEGKAHVVNTYYKQSAIYIFVDIPNTFTTISNNVCIYIQDAYVEKQPP